jgi:serine/threonine protein kinase/tetratricopeptide (TPR) repeat protein
MDAGRSTADSVEPGMTLGSYRIERLLGRGGMGVVFLAYDTTLHRHVVLKVLGASADPETSRARMLREARNAAALNHPSICTIHEVGEASGVAFIAMEYVEGRSLRDRLDEAPLAEHEAVRLGIQAADALAYAHDHGVVHRDFKAANVIVTSSGRLKIVDFGLARRIDALMASATTMASVMPAGVAAGTPYAMAPEQVRGEASDAHTDIWALGVLLHEMAGGAAPFKAVTTPELFSSILRDAPGRLPDHVPVDLRVVIERCLEKVPGDRYQRASDVRVSLEALSTGSGVPSSTWRYRLRQRRWTVAAASLAAAVAAMTFNVAGLRDLLITSGAGTGPVTLAVLPLENLTGDPDQEYFSDGVTGGMIALLSRLHSPRFSVIAPSLSNPYKRSAKPIDQIGRELNANTVLKGTVRRSGDRVQLVATLLQASTARPLWTETYERGMSDVFTLGHEMSKAISSALRVQLAEPDEQQLAETRRVNPDAYDAYLRGLSHAVRNSEPDVDQAITLFERSAALDPTFVPAQAYLALSYGNKSLFYRPNDPQWEEKGFAAARRALDLDPDAPEAHYAQANMLWRPSHGFPSREALAELRSALAAQPNFDEAWHQHGVILFHVGHLEAGIRSIQRSLQLNPGNTIARFRFGPIYVYQQKFEEAIAALDRVPRESFPAQWTFQRAWALISLGRLADAERLVEEALRGNPADQGGVLHAARAMLRAKRGDRAGAEADIAEAVRVGKNFVHFHHTAYAIGAVYTVFGELDKAQEWIENAANDGFPNYAYFETDVHLARLRATPRFAAFLAKLRMEWEHIEGEPE